MSKGRALVCLAAALGGASVIGAGPVGRAGADGVSSFTALALAEANRVTFTVPGFIALETLADGGAPVSQAQLTALGGRAFASTAYPGDTATHTEQLTGAAGLPAPPPYPLYVEAAHPGEPKAEATPPGQTMLAEASVNAAIGTASASLLPAADPASPVVAAALSATKVDAQPDGSVVARAESILDGVSFAGGFRIARIESVAVATLVPGAGEPTVQTATTVTGAEVAGTPVKIGPDGITSPQPVGLPAGTLAPVEQALAQAGISVRRISSAPVAGGASADLIEVRSTIAPPVGGLPASNARYELGGATASVLTGAGLGSAPLVPAPVVDDTATKPLPTSPVTAGGETTLAANRAPGLSGPLPAIGAAAPVGGGPGAAEVSAGAAAPEVPDAPAVETAGGPFRPSTSVAAAQPAANLRNESAC